MSLTDWKREVARPLTELLKPHGFRKTGMAFVARRDAADLIVRLQSSTGSGQALLKVTCHVAVRLRALSASESPSLDEVQWHQRIGFFRENPQDYWWECRSDEQARAAGQEIALLLDTAALPEMERLASPHAMATLWRTGSSPGLPSRQRDHFLTRLKRSIGPSADSTP